MASSPAATSRRRRNKEVGINVVLLVENTTHSSSSVLFASVTPFLHLYPPEIKLVQPTHAYTYLDRLLATYALGLLSHRRTRFSAMSLLLLVAVDGSDGQRPGAEDSANQ